VKEFIYISWLNNLGGFDYWLFHGYSDKLLSIEDTGETKRNIFPNWPKSYGTHADTITKQTLRRTKKQMLIRSQNLTRAQAEILGHEIKSAILVQLITTRRDRRTMIVDNSSITVQRGIDKIHYVSFTVTYTDDYPIQHV
jgi:hypothetical protein